jgi:octaprenyl-diphosphate synthase
MQGLLEIQLPIQSELEEFKRLFDEALQSSNPFLQQISKRIISRRGKMMRPILIILTARLHGAIGFPTYYTAVSLELLHTASLIHDDVVDVSQERRGQKSVNAIYDNQVAVLSGDYLLATSLRYASLTHNVSIIDVVSQLGRDLSDGELLQLYNAGKPIFSEEEYFNVIRKKTAALFSACSMTGSLSVCDDKERAEFARLFGEYIGICFQIRDDIFDYYNDDSIGKPTHQDMAEGKLTLPALHVLNATSDVRIHDIALRIKQNTASEEEINEFVLFTQQNGGIEYAIAKMNEFRDKALGLLSSLPDTDIKKSLLGYLDYVVQRNV